MDGFNSIRIVPLGRRNFDKWNQMGWIYWMRHQSNRLTETVALAVNTCKDLAIEVEVDTLEQIPP